MANKENEMDENKHICNLTWCEQHRECFYRNKNQSAVSYTGEIFCYHKNWTESLHKEQEIKTPVIKRVEDSDDSWNFGQAVRAKVSQPHCENPSCNSIADLKYNDKVNLCYKCLDSLRSHRSNYELAIYFGSKIKVLKLLKVIQELEAPVKEKKTIVVRCSNIYCCSTEQVTQHHLIPNPYRKGVIGGGKKIPLCWGCHVRVHGLRFNHELAFNYNTKSAVIKLLEEDTLFRLYKMKVITNPPALPKRKMTVVALNSVPSRMIAVAG
jgi:hypothetical protein